MPFMQNEKDMLYVSKLTRTQRLWGKDPKQSVVEFELQMAWVVERFSRSKAKLTMTEIALSGMRHFSKATDRDYNAKPLKVLNQICGFRKKCQRDKWVNYVHGLDSTNLLHPVNMVEEQNLKNGYGQKVHDTKLESQDIWSYRWILKQEGKQKSFESNSDCEK